VAASVRIAAVVLAAGESKRMGRPKMVLPWGERTVIEQVVGVIGAVHVSEIVVVTGGAREQVEAALAGSPARTVYNPQYQQSEMLVSLQYGLRAVTESDCAALLVALGDQPAISGRVIAALISTFERSQPGLVIPSYQNRRGHPWLVAMRLWPAILNMPPDKTMRDFLSAHDEQIEYVLVDSPDVLKDLDTPDDYDRLKPANRSPDARQR
jgi:molybdenum cofactor cytidylyltransferase